jgi:hypothetical protein
MKTAPRTPNSPRLLAYTLRLSVRMVLRLLARIFGLKPCLMCRRWTRRYVIASDMGWLCPRCARELNNRRPQ